MHSDRVKGAPHAQKGNVLFLILIAVALFAALSYAVTSSSKGGGSGISKDKANISAAEIAQYGASLEQAITRMQVVGNCAENQISFENPIESGYVNPNAPADKRCHVFDPSGGGLSWRSDFGGFEPALPPIFSSYHRIWDINGSAIGGSTSLDNELALFVLVSEEQCRAYNGKLGLRTDGFALENTTPPSQKFVGSYAGSTGGPDDGETVAGVAADIRKANRTACWKHGSQERYLVYYTLILRMQ